MANKPKEFEFEVRLASTLCSTVETVKISTIQDLYNLAIKYGGQGGSWGEKEIQDLVIQFTNVQGEEQQSIIVYDDYLE